MIALNGFDAQHLNTIANAYVLAIFITFCRVGGCLMFAPGVSSALIPVQIRLLVAIMCSIALWPSARSDAAIHFADGNAFELIKIVAREILRGVGIGLTARMFLLALEFVASVASVGVGLGNPFGVVVEQSGVLPPLATFIEMSATAMIFETNLHLELIRGLAMSYVVAPIDSDFDAGWNLRRLSSALNDTFLTALHVCSPFIIYSVIVNFTLAIVNKLTPQISVFQISAPFVIIGGLWVLHISVFAMLTRFIHAFAFWIGGG